MGGTAIPAAAYSELPPVTRGLIIVGSVVLATLMALAATVPAAEVDLWVRAELTFAAVLALSVGLLSLAGTGGRVRAVRGWITVAMALWLLGEVVRNIELAAGTQSSPALSDVPFIGVLVCAGLAYAAALRGRLSAGEELAVYLDGGIVFFATAALMVTTFGVAAGRSAAGAVDLAYAIFFLATTGATLVLDLATRAERRPHGAYVVLVGLVLLGIGFLVRLAVPAADGLHEAGAPGHFLSLGVVVVTLGVATWTDAEDRDPGYVRFAARLRTALPLMAIGLTTVIIVIQLLNDLSGPMAIVNRTAIALVLLTVAVRQTVLLRERESAIRHEREMGRELSSAELKYRSLIERQPGVVYISEPGPMGAWKFVSPQVQTMLGYATAEWIANPALWAESIHPDDREAVMSVDTAAANPGTPQRFEYRMVRSDGRVIWVLDDVAVTADADGSPLLQGLLIDITAAKETEEALRASEEQQRMILETASYAFVALNEAGIIVEWNRQAEETFGHPRAEAFGSELAELIIPRPLRAAHREDMRRYAATGQSHILSRRMELKAVHRDGHQFPVEITIWPVVGGDETRFNALIDDITARKELEEQLRHQALHDSLTGLANRVLFTDRVQQALNRSDRRRDQSVTVLVMDLDDFKTINDSLGHSAGDELLVAVSRRVERTLRPADTAARLGGDEFGILLDGASGETVTIIAERLLATFETPFTILGNEVQVHASIGVAVETPATPTTPEELLRNADLAMYVGKQRGKGRYELFEDQMHQAAIRRLELKAALDRATAEEQLEVYYQPIVDLATGAIAGFEALLRWRGPDGQFVPMGEVISLAEETGLIVPIGRFVLREACRQALEWSRIDGSQKHVAVNVSPLQLEHGTLVRDVRAALRLSGLDPSCLIVEITESALSEESLSAVRELRALRKLGVRLALDDFGTGYSSLGRLRHLPFDIVKIDRSFIARVTHEREGAVVQSILEMASTMGLDVVAEGIETQAQLLALKARGCQIGQGFYYSRPVPPEALEAILAVGRLPLPRLAHRRLQALPARPA